MDILTNSFVTRALLAAAILGPLCALLGVFVTARRMSFFSDTISHAALAGVAIGFWLGLSDPGIPLVLFSLLVAAALVWLQERTDLLNDTLMALLLSGSVALGVIILYRLPHYRGELNRYLFGDILAIGPSEVWLALGLMVLVGVGVFWGLTPLTLLTAHEDLAHVCGVPVRRWNYAFVMVLTLTVAVSIRLLGILLVTSLIVIPPAAARNLSRNLRGQIILSVAVGLVASVTGVLASEPLDVPCGPAIVMVSIFMFLVFLAAGIWRRRRPAPLAS
jgi:ABC-type Mn2+/Zn2+ transport system permease subunit